MTGPPRRVPPSGLDPDTVDATAVLDLAQVVAHGVARPAAPLTAYLVGVAVGRGTDYATAVADHHGPDRQLATARGRREQPSHPATVKPSGEAASNRTMICLDVRCPRTIRRGVERNQHVGFEEVGRPRTSGGVERRPGNGAPGAPPRRSTRRRCRPDLPSAKPRAARSSGVHEDHSPSAVDTAVAVVEPVDGGVVLVVAAHGLQQQPARRHLRSPSSALAVEAGPCRWRWEAAARRAAHAAARSRPAAHPFLEVGEARHHPRRCPSRNSS